MDAIVNMFCAVAVVLFGGWQAFSCAMAGLLIPALMMAVLAALGVWVLYGNGRKKDGRERRDA